MAGWGKVTMMFKNAKTLDDRIELLTLWANDLNRDKLIKHLRSAFRTLNNPSRYQYYMQPDTITHEKFLVFLICFKELELDKSANWADDVSNLVKFTSSKMWITLYFIMKVYALKYDELSAIRLWVNNESVESLIDNAKSGGSEYKSMSYYDYMDMIKKALKYIKKGDFVMNEKPRRSYSQVVEENTTLKAQVKDLTKRIKKQKKSKYYSNSGDMIDEMYARRSTIMDSPVKTKKGKRKKTPILLTEW